MAELVIKSKSSVIIHRPVEDVFKFIATDYFENLPKWSADGFTYEKTSEGPTRVDTTGRALTKDKNGRPVEAKLVITEYELNRTLVIKGASAYVETGQQSEVEPAKKRDFSSAEIESVMIFESARQGTRATFTNRASYLGISSFNKWFWTIMSPFWKGDWVKAGKNQMDDILDLLEGPSKRRAVKRLVRRVWSGWIVYALVFLLLLYIHALHDQLQLTETWVALLRVAIGAMVALAVAAIMIRASYNLSR